MPHLPNELWLQIASHCETRDLWLSFRQVNHQLRQCAELHFERELLSQVTLSLPVAIPTYDMRSQTRGKAIFIQEGSGLSQDTERISYFLTETVPEAYFNHFLARWKSMCESNPEGWLNERMEWRVTLGKRTDTACLRRPKADATRHDTSDFASISFDWKESMTSFFR